MAKRSQTLKEEGFGPKGIDKISRSFMPEESAYPMREKRARGARGGLAIGLIFISLGIVFLIDRFFIGHGLLGKIWPSVIITWGIAVFLSGFLPPFNLLRLLEGGLIGTVGAILLFNTLGKAPFSFWLDALALWPVFLIAFGFIILGTVNHSMLFRSFAPLTIIIALILAFAYHDVIFKDNGVTNFSFSRGMMKGIKKGTAKIDLGVGRLYLGATGKLYKINAKEFAGKATPAFHFNKKGSSVSLKIKPQNSTRVVAGQREREWSVFLSRDTEWDLNIKSGVSRSDIDLSRLKVSSLNLEGGVGNIAVRFGDKNKKTKAKINAGVSQLKLLIPKSTGVRLKINRGLSTSDFRNISLRRVGEGNTNSFETPDFDQAAKKLDLDIDVGISNFLIEGY